MIRWDLFYDVLRDVALDGFAAHDAGISMLRVAVGTFFAISGYHKLFNKSRHEAMRKTLEEDHIPALRLNEWLVPIVEFVGGTSLALGLFAVFFAWSLGMVCLVATCADGLKRIREYYHPIDAADWLDDLLYLPEILYGLMLVAVILGGPGRLSLDSLLWR